MKSCPQYSLLRGQGLHLPLNMPHYGTIIHHGTNPVYQFPIIWKFSDWVEMNVCTDNCRRSKLCVGFPFNHSQELSTIGRASVSFSISLALCSLNNSQFCPLSEGSGSGSGGDLSFHSFLLCQHHPFLQHFCKYHCHCHLLWCHFRLLQQDVIHHLILVIDNHNPTRSPSL